MLAFLVALTEIIVSYTEPITKYFFYSPVRKIGEITR